MRAFLEARLDRMRALGFEVVGCLLDGGDVAEDAVARLLKERQFDCVMTGAGLRDSRWLLLFEKVINVIHAPAPRARISFNTTPADTAEAVQRCLN